MKSFVLFIFVILICWFVGQIYLSYFLDISHQLAIFCIHKFKETEILIKVLFFILKLTDDKSQEPLKIKILNC